MMSDAPIKGSGSAVVDIGGACRKKRSRRFKELGAAGQGGRRGPVDREKLAEVGVS